MAEKFYQKAFALGLEQKGLSFVREKKCVMEYMGKPLSSFFLDFVVEDSVVVELKVRPRLGYVHIKQVKEYLKVTGLKLAILIYFTKDGVKYRRVLNTY
jgi:GxxExxY protein